jgi:hypothetical protein
MKTLTAFAAPSRRLGCASHPRRISRKAKAYERKKNFHFVANLQKNAANALDFAGRKP